MSKINNKMRIIKTARNEESINNAAENGYRPLIKEVNPSDKIRSKYSVIQNKKTGKIFVIGDARIDLGRDENSDYEIVIGWTYYYPYSFESPFAAYLIPNDIEIGERVLVEDLIEDYVGATWNQGNAYRLESCEAIWNGADLIIQHDPSRNISIVG